MPRIRQNEEQYAMKDFVSEINAQCGRYGYKSQASLGQALGVCQATARSYLNSPEKIPLKILRGLVKTLRIDPIVVLRVLGYTESDIRKLREPLGKSA